MSLAGEIDVAVNAFPKVLVVVTQPQKRRNEDPGFGFRSRNHRYSAVGLVGWRDPDELEACRCAQAKDCFGFAPAEKRTCDILIWPRSCQMVARRPHRD